MVKRPLTRGWSITSEPLTLGKVRISAHGCLQVEIKFKGASPKAAYTVGLNVYNADVPFLGGLARAAFDSGTRHVDGVARRLVNEFILGTATAGDRGKAVFKALLPAKPGTYDVQVWVSRGSGDSPVFATCYKSGDRFGDSDIITIGDASYALYTAAPTPLGDCGRRVFLDVGANTGQTVPAVLDPVYRFDRIICFEPVSTCWQQLSHVGDRRVTVQRFGLWRETCERPVFRPGHQGASIFRDMNDTDVYEVCKFVRASDWFREHLTCDDTVFLKLNCEGAECDIVDDLLESGEFAKVAFMMIDFDVRKIPSQRHREAEVRRRLATYPFPRVSFRQQVMIGLTHVEKIQNWLYVIGAGTSGQQQRRDIPRFLVDDVSW